ncbi:MraY family glycosyltransferase [Rhizobium sp. FKY42]|uniref:MraY family glycosyltransferase n=1 Tax=Rhizobium sp. FKY42 TaxID=2562310 RepID=UPI0010BFFB2D|nr:MraY family glycosyltransferase [Rhizobium sp. FKY42]
MPALFINTIVTFVLSVALVLILRRLVVAIQLVDLPDSKRKRHSGAVPLCGGIAIFAAFAIVSVATVQTDTLGFSFWFSLMVILLMGVIDDRRPLPVAVRFVMQLVMAVALVSSTNIGSLSIGALFFQNPHIFLPLFLFVGVLFVTGLLNAWNMLDGVDGLAGGTALVALIWLMLIANLAGMTRLVAPLETLAACLCAFLVFNMRSPWQVRASVFLGDAGSTALGATIGYIILLLATGSMAVAFPALIWVVILPVADTMSLIVRRLMAGRSPMSADRWHIHHLLMDYGLSATATTNALMIVSAICGAIGYFGIRANIASELMAIGLVVPIGLHTLLVLAADGNLSKLGVHKGAFRPLADHRSDKQSTSEAILSPRVTIPPLAGE